MAQTIYNIPIVINANMASNVTSATTDLTRTHGYSVSAVWTGSPVGTIELQVSRDGGLTFFYYTGSSTPVSGPGDAMWEVTTANYNAVQLVYIASSGSGTLNAGILGKGDLLV